MTTIRSVLTAAVLGVGWFAVLLVPGWTRQWLLSDRRLVALNLVLLPVTSALTGILFQRWIVSAAGWSGRLARAVLLPLVGCILYLTFWNLATLAPTAARGEAINWHDALVLYWWGVWSAASAFFVVVPYGLLCQLVMEKALPPRAWDGVDAEKVRSA